MTENKIYAKKDIAAKEFRKFARLGLYGKSLSPFVVYARIRGVCAKEKDALMLLAVYDTYRLLKFSNKESAEALEKIYFFDRGRTPKKNQISNRVRRFAYENHLDERTVYRRLKTAKDLFYSIISP